jgi:hypothetical protein
MKAREARKLGIKAKPNDRGLVLVGLNKPASPYAAGSKTTLGLVFKQPLRRLSLVRRANVQVVSIVRDSYGWRRAVERKWLTLRSNKPLRRGR